MTLRVRVGVFLPIVLLLAGVGVGCALGSGASSRLTEGKALYRTYCGQCHALAAAGVAEVSDGSGGPGFTDLKVPYNLTVVAVTAFKAPRGHRIAIEQLTFAQLDAIASFLAAATATNPSLARISAAYPA